MKRFGDRLTLSWIGIVAVALLCAAVILSTVLTLVIIPAGFSLADSFERWLAPKFGRLLTYRGPQDHGPVEAPQEPHPKPGR